MICVLLEMKGRGGRLGHSGHLREARQKAPSLRSLGMTGVDGLLLYCITWKLFERWSDTFRPKRKSFGLVFPVLANTIDRGIKELLVGTSCLRTGNGSMRSSWLLLLALSESTCDEMPGSHSKLADKVT